MNQPGKENGTASGGNPPPSLCPHLQSEDSPGASRVWSRTWQVATCPMPPGRCLGEEKSWSGGSHQQQEQSPISTEQNETPVSPQCFIVQDQFSDSFISLWLYLFFFIDQDKLFRHGGKMINEPLISVSLIPVQSKLSALRGLDGVHTQHQKQE